MKKKKKKIKGATAEAIYLAKMEKEQQRKYPEP